MTPPQITGVLETAIHVSEMKRAEEFYADVLGFKKMDSGDRFCAFDVGGDVFLLFRTGGSMEPVQVPGGVIPPHGSSGVLHFAFPIAEADWDSWIKHLEANSIAIESIVRWPRGGRSMYFRDPDNHLVELATPGLWQNY